jgi:hypothetical protein
MHITVDTTAEELIALRKKHKKYKTVLVNDGKHKREYSINDIEFLKGIDAELTFKKG